MKPTVSDSEVEKRHDKCPNCGWDLSQKAVASSQDADIPQVEQDPLMVPISAAIDYFNTSYKRQQDERRHKRLQASFVACIRVEDVDDVVEVQNFSRSGLRFCSTRLYQTGVQVKVATPYTVGGNNIFVDGRIVRTHRRPTAQIPGDYALEILF